MCSSDLGLSVEELAALTNSVGKKIAPAAGPVAGAISSLTLHGRGAGDDGPIITNHAHDADQLAVRLQENMVFIFKPQTTTANKIHICTWGDTVVVTPKGGKRLGKRPHDLAVAHGANAAAFKPAPFKPTVLETA